MADTISTPAEPNPVGAPAAAVNPSDANHVAALETRLSLWQRITFSATHGILSAMLLVLGPRGLYWFGRAFGTCEWLINFKRRKRFHSALGYVLGRPTTPGERRRQSREHFMCSRCDKLFYLIFDCISRPQAERKLTIDNASLLDEAVARGRGVYVALAHQCSLHVLGMLLCLRGYKVAGVRDRKEGGLRRFVQDRFDRKYPEFGRIRIIFADSFPREIFRCFGDGYLLGSAMDVSRVRYANQKTEEVTIFGEQQFFLSGPLRAAIRCKAPIVQAFLIPERDFQYRMQVVELLVDPAKETDEETAVAGAMRRYAANVEHFLRESPSLISRI